MIRPRHNPGRMQVRSIMRSGRVVRGRQRPCIQSARAGVSATCAARNELLQNHDDFSRNSNLRRAGAFCRLGQVSILHEIGHGFRAGCVGSDRTALVGGERGQGLARGGGDAERGRLAAEHAGDAERGFTWGTFGRIHLRSLGERLCPRLTRAAPGRCMVGRFRGRSSSLPATNITTAPRRMFPDSH